MARSSLPPGFRFHPTDVELVRYYLKRKIIGKPIPDVISEIDIYKFAPEDLQEKSCLRSRDLQWYFFCPRDKKYASGMRMNRATEIGYWKTTGKDRPIFQKSQTIGMKKTLVFHTGRAPKGVRTDWVMHEFRLEDKGLDNTDILQNAYVLCRIFKKSGPGPKNGEQYGAPFEEEDSDDEMANSSLQSLPLADPPLLPVNDGSISPIMSSLIPEIQDASSLEPASFQMESSNVNKEFLFLSDEEINSLFANFGNNEDALVSNNGNNETSGAVNFPESTFETPVNFPESSVQVSPRSDGYEIYSGLEDLGVQEELNEPLGDDVFEPNALALTDLDRSLENPIGADDYEYILFGGLSDRIFPSLPLDADLHVSRVNVSHSRLSDGSYVSNDQLIVFPMDNGIQGYSNCENETATYNLPASSGNKADGRGSKNAPQDQARGSFSEPY